MLKWLFKWTLRLLLLAVVLVVIFFLSLDTLLRVITEHRIRQQTGMQAEIGKFHLGLMEPVIEIRNLQLYNPPQFGGTPFLNIPEIHVEYDREAMKKRELHITLVRFNLGELDVVKSRDGQTNLLSLGVQLPGKNAATANAAAGEREQLAKLEQQYDIKFKPIDCLNVSVGTFKYLDLQDPKNNREQKIGIENCVITNVASVTDLLGLGVLVGLRSDDFFRPFVDPGSGHQPAQDWLKLLGH